MNQLMTEIKSVHQFKRLRVKKQAFLKQVVQVCRVLEDGSVPDKCTWKIIRKRATANFIQELVDACAYPCVIDFFYDESGKIIMPDDLMKTAEPTPTCYFIAPRKQVAIVDVRTNANYVGEDVVVLPAVPLYCENEVNEVDQVAVRAWVLAGIKEADPGVLEVKERIHKLQEDIIAVEEQARLLPQKELLPATVMKTEDEIKADKEREDKYKSLMEERGRLEKEVESQHKGLKDVYRSLDHVDITCIRESVDHVTRTAEWRIQCRGDRAQLYEDLIVAKSDWAGIHLALGYDPDAVGVPLEFDDDVPRDAEHEVIKQDADGMLPPWVGRGTVPDGSKPWQPDYRSTEVDMSGVQPARIPHGVGAFLFPDDEEDGVQFRVYYGEWQRGNESGYGIDIDNSAVTIGLSSDGRKQGYAAIEYANGMSISGALRTDTYHLENDYGYGIFENPYLRGKHNGLVHISFPDGSKYRGEMQNGKITGFGRYTSAAGEVQEGEFKDGRLHGHGKLTTPMGERWDGRWKGGQPHGKSKYQNQSGEQVTGYFRDGLQVGRGSYDYYDECKFQGYFRDGAKCGHGEMLVRQPPSKSTDISLLGNLDSQLDASPVPLPGSKENQSRTQHDGKEAAFASRYCGHWFGAQPGYRGLLENLRDDMGSFLARRCANKMQPIKTLDAQARRTRKQIRSETSRQSFLETYTRVSTELHKLNVFRQHRNDVNNMLHAAFTDEGVQASFDEKFEQRLRRLQDASLDPNIPYYKQMDHIPEVTLSTHVREALQELRTRMMYPNRPEANSVEQLMHLLASEFEEAHERQQLFKSAKVIQQAEREFAARRQRRRAATAS